MQAIIDWFGGKKTYLAGIISILTALASLFGVGLPGVVLLGHDAAIQTIITAVMGIFIRQGVAKIPSK